MSGKFKGEIRRAIFTHRVARVCNALPEKVIDADTLTTCQLLPLILQPVKRAVKAYWGKASTVWPSAALSALGSQPIQLSIFSPVSRRQKGTESSSV